MRYLLLGLLFSLSASSVASKNSPQYPVKDIPKELIENAYAVIREDHMSFTIHSKSTATLRTHIVVTIFQEKGRKFAEHGLWYSKLRKVNSFKGQVFDASGKLIKKLKNSEIRDQSAYDGLVDDTRIKYVDLAQATYPYTVEFEYEVAYSYLYTIPGSAFNQYEGVSLQNGSYTLTFPEDLRPRYKTSRLDKAPDEIRDGNTTSLQWRVSHIQPPVFEPYSDRQKQIISISVAPTTFEFSGYAGSMETWDGFGQWIASLNKGRNVLPEATRAHILQLAERHETREEKVKALYHYLQNKTRYVSIQLGIGGYQPFEAAFVDKNGYGDCKALSNYMLALLDIVGIKGHYVLIRAGEGESRMDIDFPSNQFNHAIVAVPNGADTLWLECTSQTNPFGYQGSFTGNREALLITDNGAAIAKTLRYPADVNRQHTTAHVQLTDNGTATAEVKQVLTGLQYENGNLNFLLSGSPDDQKKWLERAIDIPSFTVRSFSMENVPTMIPSAIVSANLDVPRLASVSGKRLFLTPNLMNRHTSVPRTLKERKTEVVRTFAYTDNDTIRYSIPESIYPEFIPPDVNITSRYGEYRATFRADQGEFVYTRELIMHEGTFPPETYQEFVDFFREISKADNTKVVFMTRT